MSALASIKIRESLKVPTIIEATYRIVTPMFIGDAQQEATTISPQSVKGALRFWWRALMWGEIYLDTKNNVAALKKLHELEGKLFGQATDNANAALFTLRVNDSAIKYQKKSDWPRGGNDFSGYLGLGLWESGRADKGNYQPHRHYIDENQTFAVTLICSPKVTEAQRDTLSDALIAWGLWGGLGSRSRRAFGSVALTTLQGNSFVFNTSADYQKASTDLLKKYRLKVPVQSPYTALNQGSQWLVQTSGFANARLAHQHLGEAFKNYRGQPSRLRGSIKRVFGMPYSGGTRLESEARRASPLLFHIHPIGQQYVNTVLYMPAHFHKEPALDNPDYPTAQGFLTALGGQIL
jgi:CRISPR-associated protein Cmr1